MNTARGAWRSRGRSAAGFAKRLQTVEGFGRKVVFPREFGLASSATPTLPAQLCTGDGACGNRCDQK